MTLSPMWTVSCIAGMKTTIGLPDELLIEVKKAAAERLTTIRDLVERGLRREWLLPCSSLPLDAASAGSPSTHDRAFVTPPGLQRVDPLVAN